MFALLEELGGSGASGVGGVRSAAEGSMARPKELSGPDCVAKGDGFGEAGLCAY